MASKPWIAANNNNPDFVPTGVVDIAGNPYFKASGANLGHQAPPPGGGGDQVSIATLTTRVNGALGWLTLLTAAAGAAFLFLVGSIDGVRKDLGSVQASVAAEAATAAAIKDSLVRIESKLDKQDAASASGAASPPRKL